MKKCICMSLVLLALAACKEQVTDGNVIARHCGEYDVEMSISEDGNQMHAIINGDSLDLEIAVSASGARYVGILNDTDVTLWGKGSDWTMFLNDEPPIECTVK